MLKRIFDFLGFVLEHRKAVSALVNTLIDYIT